MMTPTNYYPNPTENVLGGSITHIESPWALSITSISRRSSGDLILGSKTRFITILAGFMSRSHREVARLGSESIELWSIRTRCPSVMMRHTWHVCVSDLVIRSAQLYLFSVTVVKAYAGGGYKLLNQRKPS